MDHGRQGTDGANGWVDSPLEARLGVRCDTCWCGLGQTTSIALCLQCVSCHQRAASLARNSQGCHRSLIRYLVENPTLHSHVRGRLGWKKCCSNVGRLSIVNPLQHAIDSLCLAARGQGSSTPRLLLAAGPLSLLSVLAQCMVRRVLTVVPLHVVPPITSPRCRVAFNDDTYETWPWAVFIHSPAPLKNAATAPGFRVSRSLP